MPTNDEFEEARKFFKKNPTAVKFSRKVENLPGSSFIKTNQGIIQLQRITKDHAQRIARGATARVKSAFFQGDVDKMVLKTQLIPSKEALPDVHKEADISLDLGLAVSPLLLRPYQDNAETYKAHQLLHDLGTPLLSNLSPETSDEARLVLAIKLLIHLDELHSGKLSKKGIPYAHRDIKPENIVIDTESNLHLIDFGSATQSLNKEKYESIGTREYLPIDLARTKENKHTFTLLQEQVREGNITDHYQIDDKIAALRVIYLPEEYSDEPRSIFTEDLYKKLPQTLQVLLDTRLIAHQIKPSRIKDETPHYIAAALIRYLRKEPVDEISLNNLKLNLDEQTRLIQTFNNEQIKLRYHYSVAEHSHHTFFKEENQTLKTLTETMHRYVNYLEKRYGKYHPKFKKANYLYGVLTHPEILPLNKLREIKLQIDKEKLQPLLTRAQALPEKTLWEKFCSFLAKKIQYVKGKQVVDKMQKTLADASYFKPLNEE